MTTLVKMTAGLATLTALAMGCTPEQDPPSLIEKTRLLGARVEVAGAPERATPRPGESVTVTWLVRAPGETPPLGWAFVLCPGQGAALDCAGEPMAIVQGQDQPRVSLDIPGADALGETRTLVLLGRVCDASTPTFDTANGRPTCSMAGDGTTASVAIFLDLGQPGSEANTNPTLSGRPLSVDGQAWAPADVGAACADLPQIAAGSTGHVLRLATRAEDRETYTAMAGDPPAPMAARERLQISQFTTAGELDRAFSFIESDAAGDEPAIEVKWDAPKPEAVAAGGEIVRFTFVARDLRGGVDWTERAVCVIR